MGRLEKLVVVTVLFLVAVILGISLNSEPDEGSGPPAREGRNRARGTEEKNTEAAADPMTADARAKPAGALDSSVKPNPASQAPAQPAPERPAADPKSTAIAPVNPATVPGAQPAKPAEAAYLLTKEGLEPTTSEEFMLYTWKGGDTFKALAQKFYGSPLHVSRLRSANEGREEAQLAAGEKILVSVQPATTTGVAVKKTDATAEATWEGGLYTVKSGDVLGTISKTVYGTSKHWKKIYDANKDVIGEDANRLKVGAQLRIPQL